MVSALIFFHDQAAYGTKKDVSTQIEGLINSAQQRLLLKDRKGALELLRIQARKIKDPQQVERIRKEAQRLAEVFLTDKGQRIYELSFALMRENRAQALEKLKEAVAIEDGQSTIQMLMIRLELAMDQCNRAEVLIDKFELKEWIYPDEVLELRISLAACSGEGRGLSEVVQKPHFKKLVFAPYALGLLAIENGEPAAAMRRFLEMTNRDSRFPAPWHWLWKLEKTVQLKLKYGKQYQSLCEGVDLPLGRYKNFPGQCKNLPEVKEYILKESSDASHEKMD